MNKYKSIYIVISNKLIAEGIVEKFECVKIAREETRKEYYWKRHIIDLCNYALGKMERKHIQNPRMQELCKVGIRIAKNETATQQA